MIQIKLLWSIRKHHFGDTGSFENSKEMEWGRKMESLISLYHFWVSSKPSFSACQNANGYDFVSPSYLSKCAWILYVSVYVMPLCSFISVLKCVNLPWLTADIHTSLFLNRLFGIKSIIQTDCSSTWKIIVNPQLSWYHHANPILLLVMYYTLATLIRIWLQEPLVRVSKVPGISGTSIYSTISATL